MIQVWNAPTLFKRVSPHSHWRLAPPLQPEILYLCFLSAPRKSRRCTSGCACSRMDNCSWKWPLSHPDPWVSDCTHLFHLKRKENRAVEKGLQNMNLNETLWLLPKQVTHFPTFDEGGCWLQRNLHFCLTRYHWKYPPPPAFTHGTRPTPYFWGNPQITFQSWLKWCFCLSRLAANFSNMPFWHLRNNRNHDWQNCSNWLVKSIGLKPPAAERMWSHTMGTGNAEVSSFMLECFCYFFESKLKTKLTLIGCRNVYWVVRTCNWANEREESVWRWAIMSKFQLGT